MSWITSTGCGGPWQNASPPTDATLFELAQEWIAYILFAQCPQHTIASIVHILFLASVAVQFLCLKHDRPTPLLKSTKLGAGFISTLSFSICVGIISIATLAFTIWDCLHYGHTLYTIREIVFVCIEAAAWIVSIAILGHERRTCAPKHSMALRVWWFLVLAVSILELLGSIFRLVSSSGLSYDLLLEVEDIYALVKFPISAYLLYKSMFALTGIRASVTIDSSLDTPLLISENADNLASSLSTSGFAVASFFSKATFTWLTPVLVAGSKQSIEVNAVPELAPMDKAQSMYGLFQKNWPQHPDCTHPLTLTILKSFWPQIVYSGLLQLVRSFVMYGGPLLIPSFTSYAQGYYLSRYDGYVLVILLFLAKTVEVFSYHQFNFQCYKLGNNIRTGIVTMLYQKALRLSSSSRQSHGVGQITNYMVVDAQQISDACLQLHLIWAVPLQVIIAVVILFYVLGLSSLAGLLIMILIALITAYISEKQRYYQYFVMNLRDTRMKAIIEALAYIKVIKLQAWEEKFRNRVEAFRQDEFNWLTKFVLTTAANMFVLWNTQPLVSTFTYLTAVLIGTRLTTSIVFTAASVYRIVQSPIRNFPQALISLSQILVSFDRLEKFMLSTELQAGAVSKHPVVSDFPVVVEDGAFAWDESEATPIISGVNLNIKHGSLVTIVGTVGSGKSSLLAALLGEMVKLSGQARTSGRIAYVSQSAWIQNASIENNILFGAIKEDVRYHQVLHACALLPDLDAMDHGDQTEIGEKGINLSGGQKQRIQLARAVYQNCDVYLLDDVFSAVDAHTGSHLFKECILGLLGGKTILLVTHQVEFLSGADLILVMKHGRITQAGKYSEILTEGSDFEALVSAHNQAMDMVNQKDPEKDTLKIIAERRTKELPERISFTRIVSTDELVGEKIPVSTNGLIETFPSSSVDFKLEGSSKLIEAEQRETGKVSLMVYVIYLTKAFGWTALIMLALDQSIWQALLMWSDFWISEEIPEDANESYNESRFIIVYIIMNAASWIAVLIRVLLIAAIGLKTSQLFFLQMLRSIFRAPMSFFDTTPSGRILSRFSSDQTNLDFTLHFFLGGCIANYFSTIGSVIVICISTWPIIFFVVPLAFLYRWYQDFYLASSREITRLDSITKAPLIYHFSETVSGIETIRCFLKEEEFVQQNFNRLNSNMKMDFNNNSANEWLGLRLESIGTAILSITGLLFVVLPENTIRPEFVGLALSYALGLNVGLFWTVWLTCTVENRMVSVERIRQFTIIPSEADLVIENCLQGTPNWPMMGKIVSTRLKLRYRPTTPLVLKGVNFTIEGGHKVGVVGRTGSGKSTLILAVFRLVEPVGGQILIDNVDIAHLGLHDLRSRLGIIPQEPVLFEGTLRMNLDPFGSYSDDDIWRVLEKCQLDRVVQEKPEKLDALVVEYGGNWSVGQRQLLCFGRALLRHSKLLFLDEATASVDAQTDGVIQSLIREEFKECTVISIAHRIPTVMDSDKVLVMDSGRVKEFDSPSALLNNPISLFSSLVNEYKTRSGQSS